MMLNMLLWCPSLDVERFLTDTKSHKKFQPPGPVVRVLERCQSVRVESMTPAVVKDMLEIYFDRWGGTVEDVIMIPEEQAAIVTFKQPEGMTCWVNENCC